MKECMNVFVVMHDSILQCICETEKEANAAIEWNVKRYGDDRFEYTIRKISVIEEGTHKRLEEIFKD